MENEKKKLSKPTLRHFAAAMMVNHRLGLSDEPRDHRGTPARYRARYSKKHGHRIVVNRETGKIV